MIGKMILLALLTAGGTALAPVAHAANPLVSGDPGAIETGSAAPGTLEAGVASPGTLEASATSPDAREMGRVSPSDSSAGGLSARAVTGKRLLDANGAPVGQIVKASATSATVRTPDGHRITVDMGKLSPGFGANTVIEDGNSDADQLNRKQIGSGN